MPSTRTPPHPVLPLGSYRVTGALVRAEQIYRLRLEPSLTADQDSSTLTGLSALRFTSPAGRGPSDGPFVTFTLASALLRYLAILQTPGAIHMVGASRTLELLLIFPHLAAKNIATFTGPQTFESESILSSRTAVAAAAAPVIMSASAASAYYRGYYQQQHQQYQQAMTIQMPPSTEMMEKHHALSFLGRRPMAPRPLSQATEFLDTDDEEDDSLEESDPTNSTPRSLESVSARRQLGSTDS